VRDRRAGEDLRGRGDPAEACREVERASPVAALHRHGLAGVEPDADREGEGGIRDRRVHEAPLELDRRADRLPGRVEDGEGFVAPELDDGSASSLDTLTGDRGELPRELRSGLVAVLLGEDGVTADVGDQERPDVGVVAGSAACGSGLGLGHGRLWPERPTASYPDTR
jgi:hypothetical protein